MKKTIKKIVCDKDGKVVIVQSPNLPIVGWFICMVIALFIDSGYLKNGFTTLGGAFLFLWAYLEIVQGASYFRRLAGLIVMTIYITSIFV